jgi:hypothetical protein
MEELCRIVRQLGSEMNPARKIALELADCAVSKPRSKPVGQQLIFTSGIPECACGEVALFL